MKTHPIILLALSLLSGLALASAQDTVVTYQGRVTSNGTNFSGTGQFKFALGTVTNTAATATANAQVSGQFVTSVTVTFGGSGYVTPPAVTLSGGGGSGATAHAVLTGDVVTSVVVDTAGSGYTSPPTVTIAPPPAVVALTTFWSNDGTSVNGSEPTSAVALTVDGGLFTARLGDTTLLNMTAFPGDLFAQPDLHLRLWFNNGVNGFAELSPTQPLSAAPYAMNATTAANLSGTVAASQISGTILSNNIGAGSITSVMLASGAVGASQLASGAVTTSALADGAVTAPKMSTVSNLAALTLTKPSPATGDSFGASVAGVGNDRVLIGAYGDNTGATFAGAAYLFSLNGTLLTIFANPTPANSDLFGYAVVAVGTDRVLIGAYADETGAPNAGAAYLFNLNGTLLTTFTNPMPANNDFFGNAVAAVGTDQVLIGAPLDDTGATDAGAAYLLSTNGTLLTTFTNPTPASGDLFGYAVAAVGNERVLIGAYDNDTGATNAGAAYLFSLNGTLLTTFTNPAPVESDHFGNSVAAVGNDRVLIGTARDGSVPGVAYLFGINGTLLTTFTNPAPASDNGFGYTVAAVGNDRVLIGSRYDDAGAPDAGAAYLFNLNGTLLTTFTKPTAASLDNFGNSVAAVWNDRVLIGSPYDDAGAPDAGAAYLFSTETFTPAVVADTVRTRSITAASLDDGAVTAPKLADGAVTAAKLDPTIGVWNRSGSDVFRTSGNVGIGTSAPTVKLHVAGGTDASLAGGGYIMAGNIAGQNVVFDENEIMARNNGAASTLFLNNNGGVVYSGAPVGIGTTTPANLLHVRGNAPAMLLQDTASAANQAGYLGFWNNVSAETAWLGFGTPGSTEFSVLNTRGNIVLWPAGNVGIGRSPAANRLEVEGNASKTVAGSWLANSDVRIKTGIQTITRALDKLAQVRLVQFRYTDEYRAQHPGLKDRGYLNVVAQEFQKVFPDHVQSSGEKLPDGGEPILQVDTYPLTIYSAAAIQELNQKLTDELKRRDAENAELKQRLEKLERLMNRKNGGAK